MCLVTKGSSGPFKMTWYKDGDEVRNSDRVTVLVRASKAVLNIDAIRVEDIGNYTCTATNRFGADSLTMPLLVTGDTFFGTYGRLQLSTDDGFRRHGFMTLRTKQV